MSGEDQKGSFYPSIDQMWEAEISNSKTSNVVDPIGSLANWYNKANAFWNKADSTYNGVMSGYGNLSAIDIQGSKQLLLSYIKKNPFYQPKRVLDCGAGIGRIAKELLSNIFQTVDVVDQCQKYIDKAKEILAGQNVGHFYVAGLQNFQFQHRYHCIWIQWVLSHLTDEDAISFLQKAKLSLHEEGIIVVKENHCQEGFLVDKEDFSVSRCGELYKKIFAQAGLEVQEEQEQKDWPNELLGVKMYILK